MEPFNLTPNPRILLVLAQTAMKPIDALCELVDNAIDSFRKDSSGKRAHEVRIQVPTHGELRDGVNPIIQVSDNGPGMTLDEAENALTAGYSSKGGIDDLGLFGVGLNIATAKFARKTRLITATQDSENANIVDLDLSELIRNQSFEVRPRAEPKKNYGLESGIIVELIERWPHGDTNHDFPKRLIQNGPGRIREMLGRRYAAYMRPDSPMQIKIYVNGEQCSPFEHCVWAKHRSVPHGNGGRRINAMETFNHSLGYRERCTECGNAIKDGKCVADSRHSGTERVEEVVRGWIGVQRYDDSAHYGIDLIRNGRAIRILEKSAFFTWKDEEGREITDYPIDGPYGRIVGEVHLDHVPVNFTKDDFQRTTVQWQDAMDFLRGKSSLQRKQPGASENNSPLMQIYTGYRRVRKIGPGDLYMAQITTGKDGYPATERVSRKTEEEFYERFINKEEGYYSDEKWFELVNIQPAADPYEDCPECDGQNPASAEECKACGHLLKSKECIGCGKKIKLSADSCEHCGKSQIPEGPWKCRVCGNPNNSPDAEKCSRCREPKGAVNPLDVEILLGNSSKDESLSRPDISVRIPGGGTSDKFKLEVRNASLRKGGLHLPTIANLDRPNKQVTVFLDKAHPLFSAMHVSPHYVVSLWCADFIHAEIVGGMQGAEKHEYNIMALAGRIMQDYWGDTLSDNPEQVRRDIQSLFGDIQERMLENLVEVAPDIFRAMSQSESTKMVANMTQAGVDIGSMERLRDSGEFMRHISPECVILVFNEYTSRFFGGRVWKQPWEIPGMSEETTRDHQQRIKKSCLNCLEDCVNFLNQKNPPIAAVRRARLSYEFLDKEMDS